MDRSFTLMGYPTYPEHPTRTVRRIYVASSWRNEHQPEVVEALRTETAVRERIKVRKLSRLTVRPWSQREVAWHLGVGYERVRGWVRRGHLTGTPWRLGGGHRLNAISQTFTVADVERLIRAWPGLVQADRVRHTGLRSLVMAVSRGQRRAS